MADVVEEAVDVNERDIEEGATGRGKGSVWPRLGIQTAMSLTGTDRGECSRATGRFSRRQRRREQAWCNERRVPAAETV
jgi:hypothetical protein